MACLSPELRFDGYADAWEQRKFSDFVVASGIKNRDNLPLQSYSVSNDRGFVPQDEQFENGGTMRDADKSMYWIVEPGSFAYNPARINVGSIGYLSTSENVIVSSLYEVFRADESCDDRFLWHWFKSPLFMKQIEMLQEGGVRLYFFFDKLLLSEIWMPSVEEQRLIGAHFDRLDNLITLHQREHDKLVTTKQAMLQKMFPKPGEDVPEVRFDGFEGPWTQRAIGDLTLDISTGKSVNSYDEAITVGDIGILKTSCVSYDRFDSTECKRIVPEERHLACCPVKKGTLIVSRMNTPDRVGACGYVFEDHPNLFLPDRLWRLTLCETVDSYLVYVVMVSETSKTKLKGMASGTSGSMHNIPKDKLLKMDIVLPASIEEQHDLSRFFMHMNDLITLRAQELVKLKQVKSALLQKMFV